MEIQPRQEIAPSGSLFVRWGLRGGALAGMASLVVYTVNVTTSTAPILLLGIGAIIGGAVPAVMAYLLRRRWNPLGQVEIELLRARGLMERRLINEDDYQRIKSQVLENYHPAPRPAPRIWPGVLWGAFVGVFLPAAFLFLIYDVNFDLLPFIGIATLATGVVSGGAAQAYAALAGPAAHPRQPGSKERRLLGG